MTSALTKFGFANLLSVIVKTSILSWFFRQYVWCEDPIPRGLRMCMVYKFLCAGCNAFYVGETSRHLSTRVSERLVSDRTSHIFRHLPNSPQCRTFCSDECFNILDHASTTFQPKSKKLSTLNGRNLHLITNLSCSFKTFLVNAYTVLLLFVLSNQHFVTHSKFNSAFCFIQN